MARTVVQMSRNLDTDESLPHRIGSPWQNELVVSSVGHQVEVEVMVAHEMKFVALVQTNIALVARDTLSVTVVECSVAVDCVKMLTGSLFEKRIHKALRGDARQVHILGFRQDLQPRTLQENLLLGPPLPVTRTCSESSYLFDD